MKTFVPGLTRVAELDFEPRQFGSSVWAPNFKCCVAIRSERCQARGGEEGMISKERELSLHKQEAQ